MADKLSLLRRYWGYDSFRPQQEAIVDSVAEGHDTFVLMPTGGGKSLCYQLPALLRPGVCLVVSPLVALMKDQVQQLNNRHLKAACLVAGMSVDETTAVLYNAIAGQLKFLYVSPERLRQRRFIEHLRRMNISLIAVDEAHCVSQWGYDFRPPYLQIADIRPLHPLAPLVALTATATPRVADDVKRCLLMNDCRTFVSSFFRSNLIYSVVHSNDKIGRLLQQCLDIQGSVIVYVRSRRATQTIASALVEGGVSATSYHAGMSTEERDSRQKMWMQGTYRVMVATNAFGMGIDKSDVRLVAHIGLPDSIEAYFQEAGRAGRDGQPAAAMLLVDPSDITRLQHGFDQDYPSLRFIRNAYKALCNYYQIPLGTGIDTAHDLDLEAICNAYNLPPREFYSALHFLEREGLISIPEREELYSTLFITKDKEEYYRFTVEHQTLGDLLIYLVRHYSGLFTEPTPIDERQAARQCRLDESDVVRMLRQMHDMHVVDYRPRPRGPQVVFTSERISENDISMTDSGYSALCQAARERMEAMIAYVGNSSECRSRQLLRHFGETDSPVCGGCDVCLLSQMSKDASAEDILSVLGQFSLSVGDLVKLMEQKGFRQTGPLIRQLVDEGEIVVDDNLLLHCRR